MLKTLASLLALSKQIEEGEDYTHSRKTLDLPEYEDEDGGRWVATGKTATHFETGKTTYEYAKYDKDGEKTGERHYKDAEGEYMGEDQKLEEETVFARAMKKAIDAEERGDIKRLQYHMKNAKTARYGLKSTEMSKHEELLDKYTELRDKYDTLDEAKGQLMYEPKHTMWAVIPKSKKEFVKTFDMNKHEAAEQYARETAGKLVKIDQAGRILKEKYASEDVYVTDSEKLKAMPDLPVAVHKSPYEGAEAGEYTEMFMGSPAWAQQFAKYIMFKGGKARLGKRGQDIYVYHKGAGPISKRDFRMAKIEEAKGDTADGVGEDYRYLGAAAAYEAGAPDLLKAEMPLVRHIEKELTSHGYEKGTKEYDEMFASAIAYYRQFGNIDSINWRDAAERFKVGDKVQVKLGGKWHDAEVTDGPHKLSGHIEAKFMAGKKTIKTRFDPKTEVKKLMEAEDLVHFFLDTEKAHQAIMDKFGHEIHHDEDTGRMTIPKKHWAAVQELALAADGIGAAEDV
jgi:hypothetical protein